MLKAFVWAIIGYQHIVRNLLRKKHNFQLILREHTQLSLNFAV